MFKECNKCSGENCVKNGYVKGRQRYKCRDCGYNFRDGDKRSKYDDKVKNMTIRMYLNNCGIRRIAHILNIPLSTIFGWIKKAGKIVDDMVRNQEIEKKEIEILEMDELFTFVKKNRVKSKGQGGSRIHTLEFGLLWIGTDLKLLRLK